MNTLTRLALAVCLLVAVGATALGLQSWVDNAAKATAPDDASARLRELARRERVALAGLTVAALAAITVAAVLLAVRRVADVVGKRVLFVRLPIWFHYVLGWLCERIMKVPMVALAQVRILFESLVVPLPTCDVLPSDLQPTRPLSAKHTRQGLPPPVRFTLTGLRLL